MSPAKSHQPLHNFSLSFLKWGQTNHVNTSNRCRRHISDTTTTAHRRLSPRTDSPASSDSDRNNHNKPPCSLKKNGQRKVDDNEDDDDGRGTNNGKLSDADGEVKPWKLRPRRGGECGGREEEEETKIMDLVVERRDRGRFICIDKIKTISKTKEEEQDRTETSRQSFSWAILDWDFCRFLSNLNAMIEIFLYKLMQFDLTSTYFEDETLGSFIMRPQFEVFAELGLGVWQFK
ncbi:hypothetical protein L6452_25838 [Arctium lappa]|uniref:Uncharacterized protein n=1 Tax=Arctium lappa TaxID=4217 RepID=A0ACB9ACM3_ARCLA|nr:hypothetical protein L6452_25838 [Arctium lappa]